MSKAQDIQAAIITNNIGRLREVLDSLVASEVDLTTIRFVGRATPVSFAVYRSRLEALNVLLEYPFDLTKLSRDHLGRIEPILCSAVRIGNLEVLQRLLDDPRIVVNQADPYHETPIWMAVKFRRLDMVQAILRHRNFRIDHKSFSHSRTSPLFLASKYVNRGRQEIFLVLLSAGLPHICIDSDTPGAIEELYDGVKVHPIAPNRQGMSVFSEVALVHSEYNLIKPCLEAGMNLSHFQETFVNQSLKEAISQLLPRSLFSEARLAVRKAILSKTRKPITMEVVEDVLPTLPNRIKQLLTRFS